MKTPFLCRPICFNIARMKVLCTLLLLAELLGAFVPTAVRADAAETGYAVAADASVWFYSAENEESRLFLVPETYYVHILHEGDTFTAVEYLVNEAPYQKVVGYCRTDALTFVDFVPARPYLMKQITVSYTLPEGDTLGDEFGSIERTFVYYGARYEKGQLYYYVLADGKFGYIPAEEELSFERNDDFLAAVGGEGGAAGTGGGLSAAEIAVICIACVAAVVCAGFVIRGKKVSPEPPEP